MATKKKIAPKKKSAAKKAPAKKSAVKKPVKKAHAARDLARAARKTPKKKTMAQALLPSRSKKKALVREKKPGAAKAPKVTRMHGKPLPESLTPRGNVDLTPYVAPAAPSMAAILKDNVARSAGLPREDIYGNGQTPPAEALTDTHGVVAGEPAPINGEKVVLNPPPPFPAGLLGYIGGEGSKFTCIGCADPAHLTKVVDGELDDDIPVMLGDDWMDDAGACRKCEKMPADVQPAA